MIRQGDAAVNANHLGHAVPDVGGGGRKHVVVRSLPACSDVYSGNQAASQVRLSVHASTMRTFKNGSRSPGRACSVRAACDFL